MSRIEKGLHEHHASALSNQAESNQAERAGVRGDLSNASSGMVERLFATVNEVVSGSPAEESGLRVGDGIRRFGPVNWLNHEKLSKIAETVQGSEGVSSRLLFATFMYSLTYL